VATSLLISPASGAVLFDVDGTLANTDPLHAKAWQVVVQSHFGISFTWADYHNACIIEGLAPAEFLLRLGADVRSSEFRAAKSNVFGRLLRTELCLAPGVKTFLARLLELGITIGIVSSSSRGSINVFLETLWPGPPPVVSVSREDTAYHKPHPEPYLFALALLNRSASDCLAIEDTDRGVQSARRAGLRSVKVGGSPITSALEADIVVPSLANLSAIPDGHGGLVIKKTEASRP
jgi:beta-phosphoglucomutase-like phosphatase (HAD superfamily)